MAEASNWKKLGKNDFKGYKENVPKKNHKSLIESSEEGISFFEQNSNSESNFVKLVYNQFGWELSKQGANYLKRWLVEEGYDFKDIDDLDAYGTVYTSDGLEHEEVMDGFV